MLNEKITKKVQPLCQKGYSRSHNGIFLNGTKKAPEETEAGDIRQVDEKLS